MSISTLSQQHAQNPNAVLLQIDTPTQNETSTLTDRPRSPVVDDASISWEALETPTNLRALSAKLKRCYPKLSLNGHSPVYFTRANEFSVAIQLDPSKPPTPLPLVQVLAKLGYTLPTNAHEAFALMQSVEQKIAMLLLGNLGGALSWPIPISRTDEVRLATFLFSETTGVPGLPLPRDGKRTFGYLLSGSSVMPDDLKDPPKALEKMLTSPNALVLGQALQTFLGGVSSRTATYDYLLAAIHIGLDPTSVADQTRTNLASLDLAKPSLWGKPASAIVAELRSKLVADGKATADTAGLAAHILLARRAPQYLIKDIPASVTYGSILWATLTIAAAKIEAATPGRVPGMTYAEVLENSEGLEANADVTRHAEYEALQDWGRVSGLLPASDSAPSAEDINKVIRAFNSQLSAMKTTSELLQTPIPQRREMALAELRRCVPTDDESLYEKKLLKPNYDVEHIQGGPWRSMLDIVMEGHQLYENDHWVFNDPSLDHSGRFNLFYPQHLGKVADEFQRKFDNVVDKQEKGHKNYAQQLIAKLPLEDRRNLEEGKLEFFHTNGYRLNLGAADTILFRAKTLIVKTTRKDDVNFYQIDTSAGTVDKRNGLKSQLTEPYTRENLVTVKGSNKYVIEKINPSQYQIPDQSAEKPESASIPHSYSSARSEFISSVLAKSLRLDAADVRKFAEGSSSYDDSRDYTNAVKQFILNLIPLRAAIVNFRDGNYASGISDLALDVIGLVTLGAGKAAQAGKAVKGIAGLKGAANAVRFVGAAAVEAFNPLSGVGGLLVGGAKFVGKAGGIAVKKGTEAINKLRGASGSYDLLKTSNRVNSPTLIGAYKVGSEITEGVAVLKNGNWYKYDPLTNRPYGPAVESFAPLNGGLFDNQVNANLDKLANAIRDARTPGNISRYNNGYRNGKLESLPDYAGERSVPKLLELATKPNRTPEEIGVLSKALKERQIQDGQYFCEILKNDVSGKGVSFYGFAQIDYHARVDLTSKGDCAGLSNAMALALHRGDEATFLKNLETASRSPTPRAQHTKFVLDLRNLQNATSKRLTFHAGGHPSSIKYQTIINDLSTATTSTYLRISTADHAMLAGIRIKNGTKEWFFFDPNGGLVKFDNVAAMQAGLEKALNSGAHAATLNPKRSLTGHPEFQVSRFHPKDMINENIDSFAVSLMISEPLPI